MKNDVVSREQWLEARWRFNWLSSHGSDFNYDFGVSFTADERAKGKVQYNYREIESQHKAPKGRDEDGLSWSMAWVRHHDYPPAKEN